MKTEEEIINRLASNDVDIQAEDTPEQYRAYLNAYNDALNWVLGDDK